MIKNGPIILIDDDKDECEIFQHALSKIAVPNPLICFDESTNAINYLRTTTDKPFLILCDINMPLIDGIQLRKIIDEDEHLRKKSIPFVFYTTSASNVAVSKAYEMSVQGFFVKESSPAEIERLIHAIYEYWQWCRHPNE